MKTWMLPWLLPVGLLGAVVFVVVAGRYAPAIAVGVGLVLVPIRWRVHVPDGDDTKYWRIKRP